MGAILTPTDPVLISTVVKGPFAEKYISKNVRDLIAAESASNDALGFCFLYMPFYFTRISPGEKALGMFLWKVIVYQLILGAVLGFLFGYSFSKLLQVSKLRGFLERESLLGVLLAMTVLN